MRKKLSFRGLLLATGGLVLAGALAQPLPSQAAADSTCDTVVPVTTKSGSNLDSFTPTRSGINYDPATSALGLIKSTNFSPAATLGITDSLHYACSGDFDNDGWTDFVGTGDNTDLYITWYKNQTYQNPAPGCTVGGTAAAPNPGCASPWTPRSAQRASKFVKQTTFDYRANNSGSCGSTGNCATRGGMTCGDFNGDGKPDFMMLVCQVTSGSGCTNPDIKVYLNTGSATAPFSSAASYKYDPFNGASTSIFKVGWTSQFAVGDINGDGRSDLIWGGQTNSTSATTQTSSGGDVMYFAGLSGTPLKFSSTPTYLDTNAGFNFEGPAIIALANFTPSGSTKQLLVTGESTLNVELHPLPYVPGSSSTVSGWVPNSGAGVPALGGATLALVADYNLDGLPDVILGSDNSNYPTTGGTSSSQHGGAVAMFFKNNGTATPFAGVTGQVLSTHDDSLGTSHTAVGQRYDFDVGWTMDYDQDPDHTPDVVVADGNNSTTFFLLPIRISSNYNACGSVTSDEVPLDSSLSGTELTITSARITPTATIPTGTSIKWEASNDNGSTWTLATTPCSSAPTTDYCATFTTSVGSQIRWRGTLYSNASQSCSSAVGSVTPTLTAVGISYNYQIAASHYRSGPVAKDGLIYIGSFKEPGERGRFIAINDAASLSLAWDAQVKLDAMTDSSRNIFTASSTNTLLTMSTANASNSTLQTTLGAAGNATTTTTLINWVRAARFGLTGTLQRLGGVENSTAAVLSKPSNPYYYDLTGTPASEKSLIDTYVSANANRQQLVLVGAKDGLLHAFYTNPTNGADTKNGTEAWAFMPYDVSQRLLTDCTNASTATTHVCAATNGAGTPKAYVDGSSTLATAKVSGAYKTVLVSGEANGGTNVFALDVTTTINATTGAVIGPTPLWTFTDTNMGQTFSKPVVARVKISGSERWLAIFASGSKTGSDVGDSVYAVDMTTGVAAWTFNLGDTNCYISTDLAAAETDNPNEPGSPTKDGYIDRVFFGDSKGRVWKLDASTGALVYSTTGTGVTSGVSGKNALFSTQYTTSSLNVLNAQRGIAGSIAVAEGNDVTAGTTNKRLQVYFGTGGTDESADGVQNQFFAIYADTGAIRAQYTPAVGVRFYGGVSINDAGQLIFGTGTNGSGTVGLCSTSTGSIQAIDANASGTTLTTSFSINTSARISAPIFAAPNAVYTVDNAGQIRTSSTPATSTTTTGGSSGTFSSTTGMSVNSWKEIDL